MFKRLKVTNFQSLRKIDLELKPYTIIVGASNSGKSALIRAVKVLTMNASKPSFVRTGTKSAGILLTRDDGKVVALERGKSLATYHILDGEDEETYAKSGKDVPEAISEALAVTEMAGGVVNFASQFDKPFLLDDSATSVAQTLGQLTNLTLVFNTIKAANRRKLAANSTLKVRLKDFEDAKERLQGFKDLPKQKKALEAVAQEVKALEQSDAELQELLILIQSAMLAESTLEALPDIPPDLTTAHIETDINSYLELKSLVESYEQSEDKYIKCTEGDKKVIDALAEAEQEYHDTLSAEGICPVCGQEVA